MSRDHFFKKILNDWQIGGRCKKINQAIKFFSLQLNISNSSRLEWLSIAPQKKIMREKNIWNTKWTLTVKDRKRICCRTYDQRKTRSSKIYIPSRQLRMRPRWSYYVKINFARHQHDTKRTQNRTELQPSTDFGVVLMFCKDNFPVVRSALQNSQFSIISNALI